eukprot:COSAG02_NODE_605_length_19635_cov_7.106982_5_plen_67_part_00
MHPALADQGTSRKRKSVGRLLEYVHRELWHLGDVGLRCVGGGILRVIEHVTSKSCPCLIHSDCECI